MSVLTLILFLAPACAKQDDGAGATVENKAAAEKAAPVPAADKPQAAKPAATDMSIMDQPVNFSTPEDVDKSIEAVRQQAGDAAARDLKNALGYILTYDLSLGRNKDKMYQKLNGRTPNEIIAKMQR